MGGDAVTSFLAFLVIEGCVGIYFPMIGTMKGAIVPEDMRATIYNLYRVPLNLIVCGALLMQLSVHTTFVTSTALLVVAFLAQCVLACRQSAQYKSSDHGVTEMTGVADPEEVGKSIISMEDMGLGDD